MEGDLISAFFGALFGGGFTFFGMRHQAKANVVAEARKNWIERVQEDCVRIIEIVNRYQLFDFYEGGEKRKENYIELVKASESLRVKLKPEKQQPENPLSDADRHHHLEKAFDGILQEYKKSLDSEELGDNWDNAESLFVEEARLVLSSTWKQVKEDAQGIMP